MAFVRVEIFEANQFILVDPQSVFVSFLGRIAIHSLFSKVFCYFLQCFQVHGRFSMETSISIPFQVYQSKLHWIFHFFWINNIKWPQLIAVFLISLTWHNVAIIIFLDHNHHFYYFVFSDEIYIFYPFFTFCLWF